MSQSGADIDWRAVAQSVRWRSESHINGTYRASNSAESYATVNPATGEELNRFSLGSPEDVDGAVSAARAAYRRHWGMETPQRRKETLLRVADRMAAYSADLALRDTLEMGKPIRHALADVEASVRFMRFYAEAIDKSYGEVAPTDPSKGLTLSVPEPWGVVGIIVPWNFPLLTACMAVAPALAAGNTVVLKPSEMSPSSALLLAVLATEAGLPDGVLNVVLGAGHTVGAALARHRDVDKLHFTGSTQVGRKMLEHSAASNGKPVMLEVGGKSAHIVLPGAEDLPDLAAAVATSAFFNTGQVCVARTRLLVQRQRLDDVIERVAQAARVYVSGDPLLPTTNYGPLANRPQFEKVTWLVDEAVESGARLRQTDTAACSQGFYYSPTMLLDVRRDQSIAHDEVFGPVLTVLPYKSEDDAVEVANGTRFGLAATAWTTDLKMACDIARRLHAGRIEIRTAGSAGAPMETFAAEPFGESGHGVLGGMRGLAPYQRWKAIEFIVS